MSSGYQRPGFWLILSDRRHQGTDVDKTDVALTGLDVCVERSPAPRLDRIAVELVPGSRPPANRLLLPAAGAIGETGLSPAGDLVCAGGALPGPSAG